MATVKKAQSGKNVPKGMVESEMFPGKMIPKSAVRKGPYITKSAPKKKAKSGGSFPDLTGDGKVTKADILKGRGVIKNGGKMKKAMGGCKACWGSKMKKK